MRGRFEPAKLTNIWNRSLENALDLIIGDKGGNRLIGSKQGKLYRAPPEKVEVLNQGGAGDKGDNRGRDEGKQRDGSA